MANEYDPVAQEKIRLKILKKEQRIKKIYERKFSDEDGKILLLDLIEKNLLKNTFDENPIKMAFMQGQQAVVKALLGAVYGEDKYAEAIQEAVINITQNQEEN